MTQSRRTLVRTALSALTFAALGLAAGTSHAQIKSPGAHPKYSVELEPHLLLQWTDRSLYDDGLGLGLRASIPVIDNGPVKTINNNFAIGFGLDWSHFGGNCYRYAGVRYGDCSANQFWLPVVAQWNFFFTPVVGAFAELGLGIQHERWNNDVCVFNNNPNFRGYYCGDGSNTSVAPVFAVGPRFILADSFALTLRVGIPYLSFGASFLL